MKRLWTVGFIAFVGCSLLEKPKDHIKQFIIQPGPTVTHFDHEKSIGLYISSEVNSERPYVQITSHQQEPLSGAQWKDSLDKMILRAMTYSLQDAGMTVYQGPSSAISDFQLHVVIRHFGLEYHPGKKMLHVAYFVEMRSGARGPVRKQKLFEIKKEHHWIDDQDYIATLNNAHNELVQKMVNWINS